MLCQLKEHFSRWETFQIRRLIDRQKKCCPRSLDWEWLQILRFYSAVVLLHPLYSPDDKAVLSTEEWMVREVKCLPGLGSWEQGGQDLNSGLTNSKLPVTVSVTGFCTMYIFSPDKCSEAWTGGAAHQRLTHRQMPFPISQG